MPSSAGKKKNTQQEFLQVDTTNSLFICGGAFAGLDKIISSRTFFLSWYCDHRDLHSFPTRRSSDLARHVAHFGGERAQLLDHRVDGFLQLQNLAAHVRSEEHTSELQSRLHLVCRLLLEKKKQNRRRHTGRRTQRCAVNQNT